MTKSRAEQTRVAADKAPAAKAQPKTKMHMHEFVLAIRAAVKTAVPVPASAISERHDALGAAMYMENARLEKRHHLPAFEIREPFILGLLRAMLSVSPEVPAGRRGQLTRRSRHKRHRQTRVAA